MIQRKGSIADALAAGESGASEANESQVKIIRTGEVGKIYFTATTLISTSIRGSTSFD